MKFTYILVSTFAALTWISSAAEHRYDYIKLLKASEKLKVNSEIIVSDFSSASSFENIIFKGGSNKFLPLNHDLLVRSFSAGASELIVAPDDQVYWIPISKSKKNLTTELSNKGDAAFVQYAKEFLLNDTLHVDQKIVSLEPGKSEVPLSSPNNEVSIKSALLIVRDLGKSDKTFASSLLKMLQDQKFRRIVPEIIGALAACDLSIALTQAQNLKNEGSLNNIFLPNLESNIIQAAKNRSELHNLANPQELSVIISQIAKFDTSFQNKFYESITSQGDSVYNLKFALALFMNDEIDNRAKYPILKNLKEKLLIPNDSVRIPAYRVYLENPEKYNKALFDWVADNKGALEAYTENVTQ